MYAKQDSETTTLQVAVQCCVTAALAAFNRRFNSREAFYLNLGLNLVRSYFNLFSFEYFSSSYNPQSHRHKSEDDIS
eukprot:UN16804